MKVALAVLVVALGGCTLTRVTLPNGVTVSTQMLGPGRLRICDSASGGIVGTTPRIEGGTGGSGSATTTGTVIAEATGTLTGPCVDVEGSTVETTTIAGFALFCAMAVSAFALL